MTTNKMYAVIKRSHDKDLEKDTYDLVNCVKKLSSARDAAERKRGSEGDIFIVCNMDNVSNITNAESDVYIVTKSGKAKFVKKNEYSNWLKDRAANWIKECEGDRSTASELISRASYYSVDINKIAMALCACIRSRISYLPKSSVTAMKVLEATEGMALKGILKRRQTIFDVEGMDIDAENQSFEWKSGNKNRIGLACLGLTTLGDLNRIIDNVILADGSAAESDFQLAEVVRSYIPLRELLLAAVKYQHPDSEL